MSKLLLERKKKNQEKNFKPFECLWKDKIQQSRFLKAPLGNCCIQERISIFRTKGVFHGLIFFLWFICPLLLSLQTYYIFNKSCIVKKPETVFQPIMYVWKFKSVTQKQVYIEPDTFLNKPEGYQKTNYFLKLKIVMENRCSNSIVEAWMQNC